MTHHFKQSNEFSFKELDTIEIRGKRHYRTPYGDFPSVTTFLSDTKPEEDKKILEEWKNRVGEERAKFITETAKTYGTELHFMIEQYLKNESIPESSINATWMFNSVKPYLRNNISVVYAQEVPLYSTRLKLAGRTDCIGIWKNELTVIDFKTSSGERTEDMIKDYFIQCCAYAIMFGELTGVYIKRFAIVMVDKKSYGVQIFEGKTSDYVHPLMIRLKQFNTKI